MNQWNTINNSSTRFISAKAVGNAVHYTMANGQTWVKEGGTKAWRHTNPGNMKSTTFTKRAGAIGTGVEETYYTNERGSHYAVFPDWDTGKRAIKTLLLSPSYRDKDIRGVVKRYAPTASGEVNKAYVNKLQVCTGESCRWKTVKDFSEKELSDLIDGIIDMEGYRSGKVYKL
ncbi:MAG: hypothetical protein N4A44_01370 [Alphaproteobacteria bacterium]|jgi:hypothetical protein|nr:hypothetical protein [Alphaproteobacteria bacterium]